MSVGLEERGEAKRYWEVRERRRGETFTGKETGMD